MLTGRQVLAIRFNDYAPGKSTGATRQRCLFRRFLLPTDASVFVRSSLVGGAAIVLTVGDGFSGLDAVLSTPEWGAL